MSGFTLEGTGLDEPFPTCEEGVGLRNYTFKEQRELDAESEKVRKVLREMQPLTREVDELEEADKPVPRELEQRLEAVNDRLQDALVSQTWRIAKVALCLIPSKERMPWNTLEEFKEHVGEPMRRRLSHAYQDAMNRVGKSA